jgi:PAS domain S-box-containing protein
MIEQISKFMKVDVPDREDARRRTMVSVSLVLFEGCLFLVWISLLAVPHVFLAEDPQFIWNALLAVGIFLLLLPGLFALNRLVSGRLAGWLFVFLLLGLLSAAYDPDESIHGRGLLLFSLPIFLSSLLLYPWASFPIAALSAAVAVVDTLTEHKPPSLFVVLELLFFASISWLLTREMGRAERREDQANEELRKSEEQYRLIADNSVAWIYLIAPDRRLLYMSPSCEQMTGYPSGEFLADPDLMMRIVHPEDRKDVEEYPAETLESSVSHSQEFRIITKSGETRWIDHQCFPICDETGRVIGRRGMNLDVTERKQAEKELKNTLIDLERSNQELEQFAYVASHDLQEPLRMISSFTQLLARRYQGRLDQDADEFIAYALEGTENMQRLINDLLAYSRVGTHGKPPAPTSSGQALDRALENLKLTIEESGAEVSGGDLPVVGADDVQLTQLFQNLVANAIKFRSAKPLEIRIDCEARGGEWVFSVRDNGIGIDPQYFDRIFIVFQRLHERGKYPGTGIGLAVCKKIVQRHGGRIWVESEPGKGSTFFFSLPRSKEHADDGTEKPADRNSSG